MKIKKVQSVCLILACIAATGLIGCGKTDETAKKHEAITFMAPYMDVDSFIISCRVCGSCAQRTMS